MNAQDLCSGVSPSAERRADGRKKTGTPSARSGSVSPGVIERREGLRPLLPEPTPSLRPWATGSGATPVRLCEHPTRAFYETYNYELSTWLALGTFYLAAPYGLCRRCGMKLGSVVVLTVIAPAMLLTQSDRPAIPKTRDEAALAEWATPVAGLNVRPTHILAKEYYSLSVENLRTYPVYFPGREPEGYWDMLQHIGPKPLIEVNKLKT